MHIIIIYLFSILFFNNLDENPKDRSIFISPVKIPLALSANFGELRTDHFHSGLDIKTQGVTGKEIVAAASGYVYRINVSPGGFGKALYIRHPSGYSTVYGHLDRFLPEIEEYVVTRQYEEKSFLVSLFPPKDKFHFNQGDIIAYSGNSGSSSGPHLHYEIRKAENEIPVNPLLFDFGIGDDIEPVIERLAIYPVRKNTLINNQNKTYKINVSGGHGNYYIPSQNEIRISGVAGFGIKSFDLLNDSYNKCSVYSITLSIDSIPVFRYLMDAFSFNETRYINSHIDYETFIKEKTYFEKTFLQPNNKLSVYKDVVNNGVFNFNDDKKHHVEIVVTDIYNNMSLLSFFVRSVPPRATENMPEQENNFVLMPFSRNNRFVSKNISVNIPSGALYDTLYFEYKKSPGNNGMLSEVHHVHNRFTPLHRPYTLSIKPGRIPAGKESKMLLVQLGDDMKKNPLNSRWEEGYIVTNTSSFGSFYVGIDTIPPVINPNGLFSGANLTGKSELRIRITDSFSGINSYEPLIDNKWALFEYDQKNNLLIYRFDSKRIEKGTKHTLSLKVTDNRDNQSTYKCEFTW